MILRPPEFGNHFRLVTNTRIHRTMDQNLRVLQGNAPIWESFFARYTALNIDQVNAFKAWVSQSFGRQVSFKDFENRTWTGVITSQNIPIFQGRPGCNYSTEFDFEGQVTL